MIDIGLNLGNAQFAHDQDAVVQRARDAGVEALILTGTDLAESAAAAELAQRWPGYAFSTAGVHPHDARHWDSQSAQALRELATQPQVVAIGECGLDFNRDFSPRPAQEAAFSAQLELAAELQRPVFLHCRDAGFQHPVHLYWGVRHAEDFYQLPHWADWQQTPGLYLHRVVSEADDWSGRCGLLHEAVCQDFADLKALHVYASGSPAMVYGTLDALVDAGMDVQQMRADVFAYAPRD